MTIEGAAMRVGMVLVAVLLAVRPVASWAEFADGSAAYDGGDYQTALEVWRELAVEGDSAAQLAVADLYMAGNGVAADPMEAARWFRAAAEQGDPVGQLNLGDLHSRGLGVERDLVQAYVWFSLSAAQGRLWPRARLDELRKMMTETELGEAEAELARRGAQ